MPATESSFESIPLRDLDAMSERERDALPFGVVGFGADTTVQTYNATEARLSGLDPATVVAQRFEDEAELDDIVPYVLTLRMRPTKVRLRLLATAGILRRYVLIER
jgi:hypothetical protein